MLPDSSISAGLCEAGIDLRVEQRAEDALPHVVAAGGDIDAVLLDLIFPAGQMSGEEALAGLRERYPDLPVIILTKRDSFVMRRDLLRAGACDYVFKWPDTGLDCDEIAVAVLRAVREANLRRFLRRAEAGPGLLVAEDKSSQLALRQFEDFLPSSKPVLITGEPGTGKTLFATEFHRRGPRARGFLMPFDARESSIERDLFGANGRGSLIPRDGTLLIRNAQHLPGALRRRLENADLCGARLVLTGPPFHYEYQHLFRACSHLPLPPLRSRRKDIKPLAEFFLERHDDAHPPARHRFHPAAIQLLCGRDYPFNLTELRQAVEDAALRAKGSEILVENVAPPVSAAWDPEQEFEPLLEGRISWLQFENRYRQAAEFRWSTHLDELYETLRQRYFERFGVYPPYKQFLGRGEKVETIRKRRSRRGQGKRVPPA